MRGSNLQGRRYSTVSHKFGAFAGPCLQISYTALTIALVRFWGGLVALLDILTVKLCNKNLLF